MVGHLKYMMSLLTVDFFFPGSSMINSSCYFFLVAYPIGAWRWVDWGITPSHEPLGELVVPGKAQAQ